MWTWLRASQLRKTGVPVRSHLARSHITWRREKSRRLERVKHRGRRPRLVSMTIKVKVHEKVVNRCQTKSKINYMRWRSSSKTGLNPLKLNARWRRNRKLRALWIKSRVKRRTTYLLKHMLKTELPNLKRGMRKELKNKVKPSVVTSFKTQSQPKRKRRPLRWKGNTVCTMNRCFKKYYNSIFEYLAVPFSKQDIQQIAVHDLVLEVWFMSKTSLNSTKPNCVHL